MNTVRERCASKALGAARRPHHLERARIPPRTASKTSGRGDGDAGDATGRASLTGGAKRQTLGLSSRSSMPSDLVSKRLSVFRAEAFSFSYRCPVFSMAAWSSP